MIEYAPRRWPAWAFIVLGLVLGNATRFLPQSWESPVVVACCVFMLASTIWLAVEERRLRRAILQNREDLLRMEEKLDRHDAHD